MWLWLYTLSCFTIAQQINELILCYTKKAPLVLNVGNLNPQYLFGGISVSAAIDSHDGILIIAPYTLKKRLPEINDSNKKVSIITEVAHAMKQIHSIGIIHMDLKLENILLDKEDNEKISGFGNCSLIDVDQNEKSRTEKLKCLLIIIIKINFHFQLFYHFQILSIIFPILL